MIKYYVYGCLIFILVFSLFPKSTDWFNYIADGTEDMIGIYRPNNVTLFNQFKTKLNQLQQQLQQEFNKVKTDLTSTTMQEISNLQNEQKKILADAQKQLDSHDFFILQKIASNQQTIIEHFVSNWEILTNYWQKNTISFLKNQVNKDNPYKNSSAQVVSCTQIVKQEKDFLSTRMSRIKKGFATFFNNQNIEPFMIGYVAPGGGYRAMILTSGYLKALEDMGLLDATMYISALSGSTWFLLPWILSGMSVRDFQKSLLEKIRSNKLNPTRAIFDASDSISRDYLESLVGVVWQKYLFNQQLSSVDVYGSLLQEALLTKDQRKYTFADQWSFIKTGNKPFPLYSAASTYINDKQVYHWNELSPLQMCNLDINFSIPTYAFGSEFEAGRAQEIAPQQSLGYFMGTFGSAYLVNLFDIKKILTELRNEAAKKGPNEAVQYLVAAAAIDLINNVPVSIQKMRVLPSLTDNPFKNASGNISLGLKKAEKLLFVDAGIIYYVPGKPLLNPSRNVKVIIIGDTSGNNPTQDELPEELGKFLQDAQKKYGYLYTRVDDKSTKTLRLYKDQQHAQAPRIIYINFVRDDNLLKKAQLNPELQQIIKDGDLMNFDFGCTFDGYCNFLNFQYNEAQFKQLSGIAEFNMKANKTTIQKFLLDQ